METKVKKTKTNGKHANSDRGKDYWGGCFAWDQAFFASLSVTLKRYYSLCFQPSSMVQVLVFFQLSDQLFDWRPSQLMRKTSYVQASTMSWLLGWVLISLSLSLSLSLSRCIENGGWTMLVPRLLRISLKIHNVSANGLPQVYKRWATTRLEPCYWAEKEGWMVGDYKGCSSVVCISVTYC